MLVDNCDYSKTNIANFDIEDLSNRLDMEVRRNTWWIARLSEPQYLFGRLALTFFREKKRGYAW